MGAAAPGVVAGAAGAAVGRVAVDVVAVVNMCSVLASYMVAVLRNGWAVRQGRWCCMGVVK